MNTGDGARLQRRRGQGTRVGTDTFVLQVLPGRAGCEQKFGKDPGSVSQLHYYQEIAAKKTTINYWVPGVDLTWLMTALKRKVMGMTSTRSMISGTALI